MVLVFERISSLEWGSSKRHLSVTKVNRKTLDWSRRSSSSQGREIGYIIRRGVTQRPASTLMRAVSRVGPAQRLWWPLDSSGVAHRHRRHRNHWTSAPHSCARALMSSHYKNITERRKDFWSAVTGMWRIEEACCGSSLPSQCLSNWIDFQRAWNGGACLRPSTAELSCNSGVPQGALPGPDAYCLRLFLLAHWLKLKTRLVGAEGLCCGFL